MAKSVEQQILDQLEENASINKSLASEIKRLNKGSSSGSTSSSGGSTSSFFEALDSGSKSKFPLSTNLTQTIEAIVNTYGGLVDYAASELENRASVAIKLQVEKLTEFALDAERYVGSKSVQMIFGNADSARRALLEIYNENSYYLNKIAEDYKESDDAGLEAMTNSLIIQKAMRINQSDFQKIIQNEMASSKKYTEDVFKDIAFYAGEYANRTTASIFQITNNLTKATAEFDTFGAAAPENLGKLAGFLGELRMDTEQVSGLIKNMQSFQGSVGIVRELAGAFGAVIDPAKLMGDSINDQAEALNTIREAMFAAGQNTDTMGFKITEFAKSLGISTEAARKFMNNEIDAQEVLRNSVKESEKSQEAIEKHVDYAQKQMVDNRTLLGNLQDIIETESEVALNNAFKKVSELQTSINQMVTKSGDLFKHIQNNEGLQKFAKTVQGYLVSQTEDDRKKYKEELDRMLSADNLSTAAKLQADEMLKQIKAVEDSGELQKMTEHIQGSVSKIKVGADFDGQNLEGQFKYVNESAEVAKFHEIMTNTMNKPFEYIKTHSPSKFMKDIDENVNYLKTFNEPLANLAEQMKTTFEDKKFEVQVRLNDGNGPMTTKEFTDKIEEFRSGVVEFDPYSKFVQAIADLREDIKNVKYVANITNEGNYTIELGKNLRDEVKMIARKESEGLFKQIAGV